MKNNKKTLKERQIKVLTGNVEKWNRYMAWCRRKQWDFKADLSEANLSKALFSPSKMRAVTTTISTPLCICELFLPSKMRAVTTAVM